MSQREHSARELLRKLAVRGIPEEIAQSTVAALTAQGWQSDARFAESYIRGRLRRGFGPLRIRLELRARGIDDRMSQCCLDAVPGFDWRGRIEQLYRKRFGERAPQCPEQALRCYRFLQQRGFVHSQIQRLFDELASAG